MNGLGMNDPVMDRPSMSDPGVSDLSHPVERARRLAAESSAHTGDQVLIGAKAHRVEHPSSVLAGWVRTWCGRAGRPSAPYPEALKCRACESAWKEHQGRLGT